MTDSQFRSMKQKIGSSLGLFMRCVQNAAIDTVTDPGGVRGYFDRIKSIAGPLAAGYVRWSASRPYPSWPKSTPNNILQRLQRIDLQNGAAVAAWTSDASLGDVGKIPLIKTGEREYVIHPRGDLLYTDDSESDPGSSIGTYHLCIGSLLGATFENRSPKTHSLDDERAASRYPVPKFMLEIGKLMYKNIKTQGEPSNNLYEKPDPYDEPYDYQEPYDEFLDSGYVAILDVIDPQKPIWLIYNHFPLDDINEQSSRELDDKSVVFPGIKKNFGAAKMLSSIMDWNTGLSMEEMKKNVKLTMVDVKIAAGGAKHKDLQAARVARKKR